jgi:TolB-like protein/Tfp pilus assembly protein PilF
MTPQVFISHSSKDKEIADVICRHLESQEIPCWMAPRNIEYGSDWTEAIMRGICACRVFVLIFSENANNSGHVRREVAKASSLELVVIPFRIQEVLPKTGLAYFLETVHWLDAITPPLENHLVALSNRVKKLLTNKRSSDNDFALFPPGLSAPSPSSRRKAWLKLTLAAVIAAVSVGSFYIWRTRNSQENPVASSVLATLPAKSVAVLPFESISASKDDSYFADGVQDEILNNLAKISELKVISRTSVMQYRADTKRDMRQIACALGVSSLLEGTVRRDGNRIRVSTQLVDARSDNAVWAGSYDRDLNDIFAIQSEVAQAIAGKLSAALSPDQKNRIEAKPTTNMAAYDSYRRAKKEIERANSVPSGGREVPIRNALALLDQAVEEDPNFALAYSLASFAHDSLYLEFDPSKTRLEKADEAIKEALRLEPNKPEIRLAYAQHLYRGHHDYKGAQDELQSVAPGLPNSAEATYLGALLQRRLGNFDKAIALFNETINLDPQNPVPLADLGETLSNMRQYTLSQAVWNKLVGLLPDQKIRKEYYTNVIRTGDDKNYRAEIDALWAKDPSARHLLAARLNFALSHREWPAVVDLLGKLKGHDDTGQFAYGDRPVPTACYWILMSRIEGADTTGAPNLVDARAELEAKVIDTPADSPQKAILSSDLAVIDALLGNKVEAVSRAERAAGLLPIAKDAVDGPHIVLNLALVYAWTGELDLAFDSLESLATIPFGLFYNFLSEPYWDPLRKDPRFQRLEARLAPTI